MAARSCRMAWLHADRPRLPGIPLRDGHGARPVLPASRGRTALAPIAWRVLALIAIGWAWQMLAQPSIEMFGVFGVLPRLGLCFGLAATIAILTARRAPNGNASALIEADAMTPTSRLSRATAARHADGACRRT